MPKGVLQDDLKLHEARQRVAAIKRIDLKQVDLPYLIDRVKSLFHGFAANAPILDPGQKLYRAVKWDQKYSTVQRLSYPPAEKVTKFQRVNRPAQPMFYCSVGWNAPLFELRLEPGDHLALSRWQVTEKLIVNKHWIHRCCICAIAI